MACAALLGWLQLDIEHYTPIIIPGNGGIQLFEMGSFAGG